MARILAFDIGISSIGWAFSENDELKDCGVRIFTKAENPKTGESLALPRRLARSARKRLARRKARLNHLKHLIANEFKLNYEDYQSFDESLAKAYKGSLISPYELRFRALNELLSKQDFARVILHIAKRRGYDDIKNSDDKEKGAILKAIKQNEEKLANYQSVGEYLYKEYFQKFKENSKEFTNVRNKKESYERCIAQSFLKDELKLIFKKQREFGFSFSKKFEEEVLSVAFYKRALKDFSHLVGNCSFFTDEKRAPKNSPLAFMFVALTRIINLLNNLKNTEGILYTKDDLNALLNEVLKNGTLTYKQTKKLLGLSDDYEFKGEKGTYFIEFKKYKEFIKALGDHSLSQDDLNEIAKDITLIKDEIKLKKALAKYDLNQNQIDSLSKLEFKDHLNISFKALKLITPLMLSKNIEAVAAALYFKTLFGVSFSRDELCFENSALNYGYAIIRACIIRAVCISGLLPWLGIKHDNIYNSFALCDDLIEVFRASVDDCVLKLKGESEFLSKDDKRALIGNLQSKINFDGQNYPLNRAINHYVANFKNALLYEDELKIVKFDD
ncbi:type II CRISPR-associated endonuclease Cas1 [Campylobacter jejuni]|uniref:type II CRISPR-associated endonuclease Cas1 n=3 Tax=Campylobacter jejuni TaxID=197 RepID=UPI0021ADF1F5|nr:type II CRISPR-associated endonuclease Cas1 [Campylobacter jejuni]